MAYQPHATPAQFAAWITANWADLQAPTDLARYLRVASLLVDDYLTQCAPPFDEDPLTEATIVQAAYWIRAGIEPFGEDVQTDSKVIASASLLSGSLTYGDAAATTKARARAGTTLCYEASLCLNLAGIRPAQPIVIG